MRRTSLLAVALAALPHAFGAAQAPAAFAAPLPEALAGTGLLAPGSLAVRGELVEFAPQYPLWSDGAKKRRWLELPPGGFVDASRPDAWQFPVGTKLWKEFIVDGHPVETRFIERLVDGNWRFATYIWNQDSSDARLAPRAGVRSLPLDKAGAKRYAIPSESDCRACHEGGAVPVLGFSALQLSPDRDPLAPHAEPGIEGADLRSLAARGIIRNLPREMLAAPPRIVAATPTARAALGYLHGNCGHCHSDAADAAVPVRIRLAQRLAPTNLAPVLESLVGAVGRFRLPGATHNTPIIIPGNAALSVLTERMRSRDARVQMPPLGTAVPDNEALALIERWIDHDLPTQ